MLAQISVIVPVYNVEQYVDACVSSILAQTYRDFELILVDDGSPDRCGEICDRYAKQDSRVRVVHKTNGGLSSARNAGLDVMKGIYVTFIDSDDVVHPQYLEVLLDILEREHADISACHYDFFTAEGEWFSDTVEHPVQELERWQCEQLLDNFCDHRRKVSVISQCMKLYKKEIFDGLRIPEGYIQEDSLVLFSVLERSRLMVRCSCKLYHWRRTPDSISRAAFNMRNLDNLEVSYRWAEYFAGKNKRQAHYFQREFLFRSLYYYYKICDERPELMDAFRFHKKRYRRCFPKYIRAGELCIRARIAYTLFLICPRAARGLFEQVHATTDL